MKRVSDKLLGFTGPNPFREAQARTFTAEKLIHEFYPTSVFVSLINEQHEILLGTRGSGKTALLKMLSYSCFRSIVDVRLEPFQLEKSFIGFYVPMHLEFVASFPANSVSDSQRQEYFQFAFNCSAALSLVSEIEVLLRDCFPGERQRLIAEDSIAGYLGNMWLADPGVGITCLKDLSEEIRRVYMTERSWGNGDRRELPALADLLLLPIQRVLDRVTEELQLPADRTNWAVCIDEAEFLKEPYIECINTFMRSEKRPLVVKMATLPFHHVTNATLTEGISVGAEGHDFNYRPVDMQWDESDFEGFSNHITKVRLSRCDLTVQRLEDFLGVVGDDDWIDYFKLELPDDATDEAILSGILGSVSPERRMRYETVRDDPDQVRYQYLNKFRPVYLVRRMARLNAQANRQVGWFAGSKVVRRVADGNPRRFIQLMNDLFERARKSSLTPKEQHRTISGFSERTLAAAQGLPEYGPFVVEITTRLGQLLHDRVHGSVMLDSGCGFQIEQEMLNDPLVQNALKLAIAYSCIVSDELPVRDVAADTNLRLSYFYAVCFWLPMRPGSPLTLRTHGNYRLPRYRLGQRPFLTPSVSKEMVSSLQLDLFAEEGLESGAS
jgi:hypothetical protein